MNPNKKPEAPKRERVTNIAYGLVRQGHRYQVAKYEIEDGVVVGVDFSEVCQIGIATGYLEAAAYAMAQAAREGK